MPICSFTHLSKDGLRRFGRRSGRGAFSLQKKCCRTWTDGADYVCLANGLAALEAEDQIDTIVIAGMGGRLICEILEMAEPKLASIPA